MSEKTTDEVAGDEVRPAADNGVQSLEQIREILFGSQSRDIDSRFAELNQHFSDSLEGLSALVREHFEALTQQLENEVRKLRDELHKGQSENHARNVELESKQQESANVLEERIGSLSETLIAAERTLRGESNNALKDLREHVANETEALRNQLQESVDQVAKSSVTRQSLGEALRELSTRFDE